MANHVNDHLQGSKQSAGVSLAHTVKLVSPKESSCLATCLFSVFIALHFVWVWRIRSSSY